MKKYLAFFRMRFLTGLQYRAAALAGIVTQFFWGMMEILIFAAFYEADPAAFPMELSALSSYIWLQQAFLALYMTWFWENDIFADISDGGVAYTLCRPLRVYTMWFTRSLAVRLSKAVLRAFPLLFFTVFIKKPYGLLLPTNPVLFAAFLGSMLLAFLLVVAFSMLVYLSAFFTVSAGGVKVLFSSTVELFSGAVLPLPFWPEGLRKIVELSPFGAMQNVPFRIYSGDIAGEEILFRMGLQLFWLMVLVGAGILIERAAMRRVIVQGG